MFGRLSKSYGILLLLSISLNLGLGVFFLSRKPISDTGLRQKQFPYLSKRIFVENQNDLLVNFIPLRQALREYISSLPETVGLYFEYLPSGTSIGINEQMEVVLASLIKTPLAMGVYREIELGRLKEDDLLTMQKEDIDPKFGTFWKKGVGTTVTVSEAIDKMLIESDNTAANMLARIVPADTIDNVFDSLDIPANKKGELTTITPKSYSSIFRSLYLSSYLSEDSSNTILEILTRTNFNDKVVAGVGKDVKVSHKIGIFNSNSTTERAYSDCGIVYIPQRPHMICIMTKANEQKTQEYMSHISKMIYSYVSIVKGGN